MGPKSQAFTNGGSDDDDLICGRGSNSGVRDYPPCSAVVLSVASEDLKSVPVLMSSVAQWLSSRHRALHKATAMTFHLFRRAETEVRDTGNNSARLTHLAR